jgi:hypothetical protein
MFSAALVISNSPGLVLVENFNAQNCTCGVFRRKLILIHVIIKKLNYVCNCAKEL